MLHGTAPGVAQQDLLLEPSPRGGWALGSWKGHQCLMQGPGSLAESPRMSLLCQHQHSAWAGIRLTVTTQMLPLASGFAGSFGTLQKHQLEERLWGMESSQPF